MFEHRTEKLLPICHFVGRMLGSFSIAVAVIALALGIGVLGYHHFAGLSWIDSLLNASMILTGMGPIDPMRSDAAKLFASLYALFSGVVFLTAVALLLSPIFHRLLHHFHLDDESQ